MSPCCVHDLRGGGPGSISFEVQPQPPPDAQLHHPGTSAHASVPVQAEQHLHTVLCHVGRRRVQATRVGPLVPKLHGVAVLCTSSTVRLKGERSAFNESEGVLLHRTPLTRLLAQQCFRQRKCREGLAAPRNLLTTCLSRSQWWFLDQSFAPVDYFLLLSQQGVSRRRLSFRLLNRSPFARFSFSLFVSAHLAISIMLWAAMFS
ncbi:hypothetical protein J3F84DRAFT_74981 [Trichoderma pleuroticola]